MFKIKVLLVLILTIKVCSSEEKTCEIGDVSLVIHEDIDSESESLSLKQLKKDVFNILITDQTVEVLCPNHINIKDDVTILQILNCSLKDIQQGAFQIDAELALLKISKNLLTTVNTGVFDNVKTKELDLSNNIISTIDQEAFDNNPFLQIVRLDNNLLKELNPNWFSGSPNVYKISIVFNEVTEIPASAFKNMAKSRGLKLKLSANLLRSIHPEALNEHTKIDLLRINGNKLVDLPEELFINKTIRSFQANTNKFKCFPDSLFKSDVQNIEFLENPTFDCDCLKKVRSFVEERNISVTYPAIICEDKVNQKNVVYNYNRTYEIPILPPSITADVASSTSKPEQLTNNR